MLRRFDIASIEAANGNGTIDGTALTDIDGTAAAVVQAIADIDSDPTDFDSDLNGVLPLTSPPSRQQRQRHHDGTALTDIDGTAAAVVQAMPISIQIPPTSTPISTALQLP